MKVAPSFTDYIKVSDIYDKNGRAYIDVKNPRTGNVRSVRAYTDYEWQKAYGAQPKVIQDTDELLALKLEKGFKWGPIMLISTKDEKWLNDTEVCRYSPELGWYIRSTDSLPYNIPNDLKRSLMLWSTYKELYYGK